MAPWFKVDDGLSSKAQTTRIPRAHRRAALGLWALAGSWSAKELTDGHIPEHMLEELTGTPEDAAWLVKAEYWTVVVDGWQFVEWEPDQPLREVVLEARRKNTEKVKDWRSRNRVSNPVTNPTTNAPETLPPSQPNPTQVKTKDLSTDGERESTPTSPYSEAFEAWWTHYPRRESKGDALKAWEVTRKARTMPPLADLIAAADAYARKVKGNDPQFVKLPAGWLRDRKWEDESPAEGGGWGNLRSLGGAA